MGHRFPSLLITRKRIPGAREPDFVCPCVSKHTIDSVTNCVVWAWHRGDDEVNPFGARSGRERSPRVRSGQMPFDVLHFKEEINDGD
jgi:hypothetical protein